MDFCRNVTFSGEYHQQDKVLASPLASCSKLGASLAATANPLDDLFPAQNTEVDVSLEWLSVFVEDCLSSTGNCVLPAPTSNVQDTTTPKPPETFKQKPKQQQEVMLPAAFEKFVIPVKARSKRKRVTSVKARRNPLTNCWSYFPSSDPPLLQQTHWLADSELIMPNKGIIRSEVEERKGDEYKEGEEEEEKALLVSSGKAKDSLGILESNSDNGVQQQQQPRRCTHCLAQRTPQWRAGPLGPKTLCNACGVRYKSGRLLPEYRPAKSPTFVSYLHSNSHKKVLEMRMASSAVFNS